MNRHQLIVSSIATLVCLCGATNAWSQTGVLQSAPPKPTNSTISPPARTVVVSAPAPIYLQPNASLEPFRVAKEGSALRLLERAPDWSRIQFQDPEYGRRIGYIQTKFLVEADDAKTDDAARLTPLDLTIPEGAELQPPQKLLAPAHGEMPTKYKVWGSVLMGLSGYYLISYAVVPEHEVVCITTRSCVQTDTLRTAWLAMGVGLAAGGIGVFAAGEQAAKQPGAAVMFMPSGFAVQKTIAVPRFRMLGLR